MLDLDKTLGELIKDKVTNLNNKFIFWEFIVPVSWKVFDERELEYAIESILDFHWTEWRRNDMFEKKLWEFLWVKYVMTTNSWSSANLLALTALTAKELKERQLQPGDEVITVACGFPTTINPIIQNWLVPVFVDVDLETYEINIEELKKALSLKTKAIMIAHTLWNAFNLEEVQKICKENNLWLIEDNCDALWTRYNWQYTGTFGDIATCSFYPAHHITMWEGWALLTNSPLLAKIIKSYRDRWRDCWCKTGEDASCKARYKWKLWNLPEWFDHKYTYSRLGYNLKVTDMQASLWVAQIEKLEEFIEIRKHNFKYLKEKFIENWLDKYFILPEATPNSDPSWFGFVISLKENVKFNRQELIEFLNENKIWTRLLFAWNFLKQPAFLDYVKSYKVVGELKNTDYVMNNTFWIGVYQGLTREHLDYVILKFKEFLYWKKPLISILIPTYNRPWFLKECLDSVLEQKWFNDKDLEIIVSDNSKDDKTKLVVQSYISKYSDKNIIYNKNHTNLWMVGNWNKLLEMAKGEYFIFSSDDDKFFNQSSLISLFTELKSKNLYSMFGLKNFIDWKWDIVSTQRKYYSKISLNKLKTWNLVWFWWTLFKKFDYVNFDETLWFVSDWDFNLKYIKKYWKISVFNKPFFVYRIHDARASEKYSLEIKKLEKKLFKKHNISFFHLWVLSLQRIVSKSIFLKKIYHLLLKLYLWWK